jgi:hypothetical protein
MPIPSRPASHRHAANNRPGGPTDHTHSPLRGTGCGLVEISHEGFARGRLSFVRRIATRGLDSYAWSAFERLVRNRAISLPAWRVRRSERRGGGTEPVVYCLATKAKAFKRKDCVNPVKRTVIAFASLLALIGMLGSVASATSGAHFFSASGSIDSNGGLNVKWDEAGVGQQLVSYTLTAQNSATYACINGGNNHPSAANKEVAAGPLSQPLGTFSPLNGRIKGSGGPVGPLPAGSTFSCPNGQKLVLAKVTYSGITLTDNTNNVSTGIPDVCRSFSALFPCP